MFSKKVWCALSVLILLGVEAKDSDMTQAMKEFKIIPDVIDNGPKDKLTITYGKKVIANNGIELTPTETMRQPMVKWKSEKSKAFYTLIMTDPDAPSRKTPTMREWHHWMVVNIPGSDLRQGEIMTEYIGPAPPKDTDLHRYVFLLFKQDDKIKFEEKYLRNNSAEGRDRFSTRKFIEKYHLNELEAGNFFQSQYDDSVPQIYQQLGVNITKV